MLKNYLKTAWRNLLKSKSFSVINIIGLATGMAAAILILLWIQNEVSMDRQYPKADRMYQMYNRDKFSNELWTWGTTPKILGPTLKKDYPEVEEAVRVSHANFLMTVGDKKFNESGMFTDSSFLNVFDFPVLAGDRRDPLKDAHSMVVTKKLAKKLFDTADAVGKTVKIDNKDVFTVTAVLEDHPNNSTLRPDYLMSWSYMKQLGWDDEWWGNNSVTTYVLLRENARLETFNKKVRTVTIDHTKDSEKSTTQVYGYPVTQTYLYGKSENGKLVGGRIVTVRMFAFIAVFILLIACINFMNLSTARSEKRAKEVGIRKVVGSRKSYLIFQFIGESILLALLSGILALLMVQLGLPVFNKLVNKELYLDYGNGLFYLELLSFILFTGLVAGSYPAFFLSSFNPVLVLKGTFRHNRAAFDPRKVLVVTQFTFAIILIISTLIIERQIRYAQARELGYNKENLIYINLQGDIEKHYASIKQALLSSGAVSGVTKSMSPISQRYSDGWGYSWPGSTAEDEKLDFVRMSADADFTKVIGTTLVEGRDIDIYAYPGDSSAVLLNETAIKKMRLDDPVGKFMSSGDDKLQIVGIIKDFIFESPYDPISPVMVMGPGSWFAVMHVKLNGSKSVADNLKVVEDVFHQYNADYPFEYRFVDDEYAKKFTDSERIGTLAKLFAGLTILISCLGLFGLSAYMAANRIKEIGVRKVLGASVASISMLLSKDFLKLVVISFVIAAPIAAYLMNKWLHNYDYRTDMGVWVFAGAGFVSVLIALLTVSFQAIKAATANPVKSLRSE